jgi:hypothetical protein
MWGLFFILLLPNDTAKEGSRLDEARCERLRFIGTGVRVDNAPNLFVGTWHGHARSLQFGVVEMGVTLICQQCVALYASCN